MRGEVRCAIRLLQLTSSSFQAWHRQSPTDFQLFMGRCVAETLHCKTGLRRCQRKLTAGAAAGHHVLQKPAMKKVEIQHAHCRSQEPETLPALQNLVIGASQPLGLHESIGKLLMLLITGKTTFTTPSRDTTSTAGVWH